MLEGKRLGATQRIRYGTSAADMEFPFHAETGLDRDLLGPHRPFSSAAQGG